MDSMIEVSNLQKQYQKGKTVVNNISFKVEKGDVFGFLGPNGAGKTTTIKLILGLLKPDAGEVYINGLSVKRDHYQAVSNVGALIEGPAFYEYLSAQENLEIFGAYSQIFSKTRVAEVLRMVNLEANSHKKVGEFSTGMKQRLGIAQALLNNPKLLLLDEPTNGLDPFGIKEIRELILQLKNAGTTIFVSSHILAEVQQICNKVLIINKGCEVVSGLTDQLLNRKNIYEIECKNIEKLDEAVHKSDGLKYEAAAKNRLISDSMPAEELLKYLIYEGVKVTSFSPVKLQLEEYFFDTLKEK